MMRMTATIPVITLFLLLFASFAPSHAEDRGEKLYTEAFTLYKTLAVDPDKVQDKEIWQTISRAFYSIYKNHPSSSKAPNSLFLSGKMYEEMGERFGSRDDFDTSIEYSRLFVRIYADNSLADDAQLRVARIVERRSKRDAYSEYEKVVSDFPNGDMKKIAGHKLQDLSPFKPSKKTVSKPVSKSGLVKVSRIRHWSTDNFTRVVIHVDKEMPFTSRFLKADPKTGKPPRLFVDIKGTRVDKNLDVEPIKNGLLEEIKFARNTHNQVRVVLYIKSFDDYKVFALRDPFRIVMDIHGSDTAKGNYYAKEKDRGNYKFETGLPEDNVSSLSEALGLKIRTVVIDAGHGGHDPGAIGNTGLKEKDVTLKIAKTLKAKLEKDGKKFGITKVHLTRSSDKFIPLEERTGIAKKLGADLFISVHCNAARNRNAYGTETYILSFTNDQRSLAVAARENATTSISRSDMDNVLKKYLLSAKINESERLASYVQGSVIKNLSGKYKPVKDKGVKKAPFIVLLGADIPSILVETSFITNPTEEKRLKSNDYINELADGIFTGIKRYSTEVQTASIH
jgi:N-acetylmuramoyl-L-alanine amidase